MSDDKKVLQNFFSGLPHEMIKDIVSLCEMKRLAHNESIVSESPDTICIVLAGELDFFSRFDDRKPVLSIPAGMCARQTLPVVTARSSSENVAVAMIIHKNTMDMIHEKAQLFLYRKIYESDTARLSGCISSLEKREYDKANIVNALKEIGLEKHKDHSGFEAVQKILNKIKRLPSSIENLMAQIASETVTARSLADLIKNDPSMTALVLKRINSSYYSLEKKIADINYAIFYLGLDQIYHILISEGLRNILATNPAFQKLYFHSVIISHISNEIARLTMTSQPSVSITIALLHDLGQNVKFLLKEQNPKIIELIDFLDPAEMGSFLLKSWNLPESISDAVKYHMYPVFLHPDDIPATIRPAALNLFVSHLVCDYIQYGYIHEGHLAFTDECLDLLGWGGYCIGKLCDKILMPEFKRRVAFYPESFREFLKLEESD